MSHPTLDERVAALELAVAQLSNRRQSAPEPLEKDWRSSLGMFADDPIMKLIIDEGQKIREKDREQTPE